MINKGVVAGEPPESVCLTLARALRLKSARKKEKQQDRPSFYKLRFQEGNEEDNAWAVEQEVAAPVEQTAPEDESDKNASESKVQNGHRVKLPFQALVLTST